MEAHILDQFKNFRSMGAYTLDQFKNFRSMEAYILDQLKNFRSMGAYTLDQLKNFRSMEAYRFFVAGFDSDVSVFSLPSGELRVVTVKVSIADFFAFLFCSVG